MIHEIGNLLSAYQQKCPNASQKVNLTEYPNSLLKHYYTKLACPKHSHLFILTNANKIVVPKPQVQFPSKQTHVVPSRLPITCITNMSSMTALYSTCLKSDDLMQHTLRNSCILGIHSHVLLSALSTTTACWAPEAWREEKYQILDTLSRSSPKIQQCTCFGV